MNTCDDCDQEFEEPQVGVFTRRPSDPTDLCCILWFCPRCAILKGWRGPDYVFGNTETPYLATFGQAEEWISTFGQFRREDPIIFLT